MGLGYETEHPFDDEPEYPAKFTMHTPTGTVHCCVKHARQIECLMNMLGAHTKSVGAPHGAECSNCKNEAQRTTPNAAVNPAAEGSQG